MTTRPGPVVELHVEELVLDGVVGTHGRGGGAAFDTAVFVADLEAALARFDWSSLDWSSLGQGGRSATLVLDELALTLPAGTTGPAGPAMNGRRDGAMETAMETAMMEAIVEAVAGALWRAAGGGVVT